VETHGEKKRSAVSTKIPGERKKEEELNTRIHQSSACLLGGFTAETWTSTQGKATGGRRETQKKRRGGEGIGFFKELETKRGP